MLINVIVGTMHQRFVGVSHRENCTKFNWFIHELISHKKAVGDPIQFEPLTSYPEKMMCNWDASRLSRDKAEILTPNTERDFVELPVQYACVMTQQK